VAVASSPALRLRSGQALAKCARTGHPPGLISRTSSTDQKVWATPPLEIHDPDCEVYFSRYVPDSARLYAYERFREMLLELHFK